jgi:sodium/hydrogen antiporter
MNQWVLPTIAVLLIGYGAVSGRLQSTVVTQAMVFVALGLLVGNRALGLVEVDTANQFVRLLAEATLALVLFTDAARVKLGRLRRESALPARLLGLGLPLTIVAGTLAGLALSPSWTCGRRPPWPPSWPPPTLPWGCRWSATSGSPPVSARA